MTIGQQYIDLVAEIYGLDESTVTDMQGNDSHYTNALGKYYWDDVKMAINHFFMRKSDKTAPRLAQILAILELWESEGRIGRADPRVESPVQPVYCLPTTKIWSIAQTFDKMIKIMVKCRVLPAGNESDAPTGAGGALIDPATNMPILCPKQWIKWQVQQAMATHPDIYSKFPGCTMWEGLALALQNKLVTFKVRNYDGVSSD